MMVSRSIIQLAAAACLSAAIWGTCALSQEMDKEVANAVNGFLNDKKADLPQQPRFQSPPKAPELESRVANCRSKLAERHIRGYAAMAVGANNCGVSWNFKTRDDAISRAARECNEKTTGCRVVLVRGSG